MKSETTRLTTDRICYLQQQIPMLRTAQPITYALEMRILEQDILAALDIAWKSLACKELREIGP